MQMVLGFIMIVFLSISAMAQELPAMPTEKKPESPEPVSVTPRFESVNQVRGRHGLSFSADWSKLTSKLKMNQTTTRDENSNGKYTISYNYNLGYVEPRVALSWQYKNEDDVDTADFSRTEMAQLFVGSDFNIFPNEPSQVFIPFGMFSLGYLEQKESVTTGTTIINAKMSGLSLSAGIGAKYFPLGQNIFAIRTEVTWATGINLTGDVHVQTATTSGTVDYDFDATQTALNVDFCLYF